MLTVFWIVYAVFVISQGFIAYRYISTGNKLYLKSVLMTNISFALYLVADAVFGINVPYLVRLLAVIALFVHTFFGYFKDRYTRSQIFDRYLHVYGTFAYALLLYGIIDGLLKPSVSPRLYAALFIVALGIAVGAVFETVEYFVDKTMPVKTQRGLKDTDVDLICDVIGAALAGIAAYLFWL